MNASVHTNTWPNALALVLTLCVAIFSNTALAQEGSTAGNTSTETSTPSCNGSEGGACGSDATTPPSSNLPRSSVGNPINLLTGNKHQSEIDFDIPGAKLTLTRSYNSVNTSSNYGFGQGWTHTFAVSLFDSGDGTRRIVGGDGRRIDFFDDGTTDNGHPLYRATQSSNGYLTFENDHHLWHLSDGRVLSFKGSFLVNIDWPDQRMLTLFYRNWRLHSVTDETSRVLQFNYTDGHASTLKGYDDARFTSVGGYLSGVTLPDSSEIGYDYDSKRNLTRVRFPDGTSREYHYEDEVWPNRLTGLTDRTGVRFATWSYDDQGRAISSEHANGVEKVTLQYPDPVAVDRGDVVETVVTNSLGAQSVYTWQKRPGLSREVLLSSYGSGCVTCPPTGIAYEYDQQGRLLNATKTGLGNAVGTDELNYRYDEQGRLFEVRRLDAHGNDELVERREFADAHSQLPVRTYYPSVNPNGERLIEIERDPRGQPLRVIEQGWKPSSVQSAEAIAFTPIERITTLTYQENQLSTVDGPRTDVDDITRFQYDSLGRVLRIELPSNEVVTIHDYDEQGRAVGIQRANHPRVTLQYDDNGNVSRVTRLGQSVQYTYNAEDSLVSVTNSNGKTTQLSYDDARRLTRVSDDLERTVSLTFNNEGQLKQRTDQGINGELIRSLNYVFDIDGRIQSVGEEKQDNTTGNLLSKRVDLHHDASGQLTTASDLQTGATRNFVFNRLGQLLQNLDANGLPVSQEYDVHSRLSARTDERQNTTRYHRDDFGQVHFLVSPDTGVTQYDYDAAGNRTQKRNSIGEITRYRWDAANRLVEQQDIDGTATYVYDRTNGQLIEASNAHSIETYTYTRLAQLKTHT